MMRCIDPRARLRGRQPVGACQKALLPALLAAILGLLLAGCATQPQQAPPTDATPPPVEPPAPRIPRAQLYAWLDAAEQALRDDHLTWPETGSALAIYQQILALDPQQAEAQRGLEAIVERFVQLALQALEQRRFAAARSMLARGRLILPNHPSIEPTASQIRLISEADRKVHRPDAQGLAARDAETVEALRELGNYAAGRDCRFLIAARNDAQGRWLYRQLSEGLSGERLRARVVIRAPVSVERLCFD